MKLVVSDGDPEDGELTSVEVARLRARVSDLAKAVAQAHSQIREREQELHDFREQQLHKLMDTSAAHRAELAASVRRACESELRADNLQAEHRDGQEKVCA